MLTERQAPGVLRARRARRPRATTARAILQRYGKGTQGDGWYSFDHNGVHFIGLVNVVNLKAGGLGSLGAEQLDWLENDVEAAHEQHAHRRLRAHPAVGGLPRMGLGHRRQRAGACPT